MLYLAAAVSDFFVPFEENYHFILDFVPLFLRENARNSEFYYVTTMQEMAEHKMQSSAGAPEIKLTNSPKMLMPLRHIWCPEGTF